MYLSYRCDFPQGYSGKLPGTVGGVVFDTRVNILGCRKYQTGNKSTKLHLLTLRLSSLSETRSIPSTAPFGSPVACLV